MKKLIKLFEKLKRLSKLTDIFGNFRGKFSNSLIGGKFYKNINNKKLVSGNMYKNFYFHKNFFNCLSKSFYTSNDTLEKIFSKVSRAAKRYDLRYFNTISNEKFDIYKSENFLYKLGKVVSNPNSLNKKLEERKKTFLEGFVPLEIINNVKEETIDSFDSVSQKIITDNADIIYTKEAPNIINTAHKNNDTRVLNENISDDVFDEFGVKLANALKNAFSNKDRTIGYGAFKRNENEQ